jgi:putative ABC transport system ATP-binding protein
MSENDIVRAEGLVKRYDAGRITALDRMSITIRDGEHIAIVGPSGCGKSTLVHLIAALDRPDEGTLVVAGHDLAHETDLSHFRARHAGIVFQLHNLLPTLTAIENVEVPMFELGVGRRDRVARARTLLGLVGLADREGNRPAELSGGERQRVAIARALANDAPLVLADEPTGALDSQSGAQVLDLLERIQAERGKTLVVVTHDPGIAARADRTVRMLDGRTVEPWVAAVATAS